MEYTIAREKSTVSIKVTSSEEEWNDAVNKAYQKTKGQYRVPGFRQGKAPRHMIEQMYGASVFMDDAMDYIINEGYFKALTEHTEIDPIDRPQVEIDSFENNILNFTIKVSVKPDIKFGDYKSIKLEKIEYNVTESDVEEEVQKALKRNVRKVETDKKAKSGDTVNIDYKGTVDGVAFDGGTAEKQDLVLGSNTFIPGFEDQLIGHKKGDEVDVKVTFPAEYHAENLKGKDAVFACKVNTVTVDELPVADDKWASEVSEFETLDAYKASLKEMLEVQAASKAKTETENAVINAIVDKVECDMPDALVEAYLEDMLKDVEMRLMYQGLKIEDYFKYTGSSVEQFKTERREEAKRGALTRLCLEQLLKEEEITVTDEDATAKYFEMYPKAKEEGKTPESGELNYFKNDIAMEKLLEKLIGYVTFTAAKKAPAAKKTTTTKKAKTEV